MIASRQPHTNQDGVHPHLTERVQRHQQSVWRQPIHAHTQQAFDALTQRLAPHDRGVVIDSGCGCGHSTRWLAERFPDHDVIGVDRSEHRLARTPNLPAHAHLIRADLADFWRLVVAARWPVTHHFLLYPNPYPKARHLQRRWYAHPVWPDCLKMATRFVLRTNFELYARECELALIVSGMRQVDCKPLELAGPLKDPISAFEAKYAASGHPLFEVTAEHQT